MKDFSLKDSNQAVYSNITVFGAGRRRRKGRRIRRMMTMMMMTIK